MAKPKDLQDASNLFDKFLDIQKQCIPHKYTHCSDYMVGMYNGIAFGKAIIEDITPKYMSSAPKPKNKVRYKRK